MGAMAGLKQSFFESFRDCTASGVNVKLGVDVAKMSIHRVDTQREFIGDFLLNKALRH
jgi:hypothetical protein